MNVIQVAIGLIMYQGKILLGWRDEALHQGGRFEFPGGKIEKDEQPEAAVIREIKEEVGIDVEVIKLFQALIFNYPDRTVHLSFYVCQPNAAQLEKIMLPWQWIALDELKNYTFPEANQSIIQRLNWTRYLAVTPLSLEHQQVRCEIDLCYLRLDYQNLQSFNPLTFKSQPNVRWIIRSSDFETFQQNHHTLLSQVFALHLSTAQLHQINHLDAFDGFNVIAACHNLDDIAQANHLGCDAILLSPVLPTPSHPDALGMGWTQFKMWASHAHMPVYAMGGIQRGDLELAQAHGAYGVAGISDFWQSQ